MTKEQSLFIKILKSQKYKISTDNWGWLDEIANKLTKRLDWRISYKELFKNTNILNTSFKYSKSYTSDLPFIDGVVLLNFIAKTSLTKTISRLEEIFKGQ